MRAFTLSDITSPVDQVTTIPFLFEGDAVEYYHSLTKVVHDDWFELMPMLGQRFDCISHAPVYLSRMLTFTESDFPRHGDYMKEFGTCVIKSKVNTSDLQMGYLGNSRFVEVLSNNAVRRQYVIEVRSKWAFCKTIRRRYADGDHRRSLHGGRLSTLRSTEHVENNNGYRGCCGLKTPAYDGSANFDSYNVSLKSYATAHVNPMLTPAAAPMASTVPEPMNLNTITMLREELHAHIGERRNYRFSRQHGQ